MFSCKMWEFLTNDSRSLTKIYNPFLQLQLVQIVKKLYEILKNGRTGLATNYNVTTTAPEPTLLNIGLTKTKEKSTIKGSQSKSPIKVEIVLLNILKKP